MRHAVRQILRTLDHYTLEAIPFPAPVGGWWDMPCEVIDTRFPREVLLVNRFEGEDYYPAEPVVPLYPDLAELSEEAWSRFDYEDDDDFDYALDVQGDAVQDQIGDYLEARDLYGSEELHPGW